MEEILTRKVKGIWIPIEIWEDKNLNWNEKILFLEIDSYTTKDKDCYISNEYISKLLHINETSANKILSSLIQKGYVIKTSFDGRHRFVKSALSISTRQGCDKSQGRVVDSDNIPNIDNNKNNKKESTKVDKKEDNKFDFKKSLLDMGVEEQVVLDWLAVRKNKKASNTETVLKSLKKQIELTNASPNECIKMAAENSWQGFKAKWYLNEINSIGSPSNVAATNDQYKSDNEDYAKFRNWMKENCPSCDDPTNFSGSRITEQEFFKLKEIYSGKDIADVIMAIENRKDLRGKYASLYITVCTWLKNRKQ
jgi:biotin operon repressor